MTEYPSSCYLLLPFVINFIKHIEFSPFSSSLSYLSSFWLWKLYIHYQISLSCQNMNQLDNVHYYYHYLKHFEYLGLYHFRDWPVLWVIYLDLLFFVLSLVSLITSHWSTSDQSIYCKSLLPDTLTQILCFLSWSPANPIAITH